ncbi:MAG: lipopolysaccharide assembly protein LapA domain-containing protein [Pseudomonadota bacterium]
MQFLKTLLIVFTVGLAVAFAFNNWTSVDIRLWGGLLVDINKPLLLLVCFLLGLAPTWLWYKATNWRLRQRLSASERTVADLRAAVVAPTPVVAPGVVEPPLAPPLIDDGRS